MSLMSLKIFNNKSIKVFKKLNNLVQFGAILLFIIMLSAFSIETYAQKADLSNLSGLKIGRVKYSGGGDWYNDPSSEENLLKFIAENTNINVVPKYEYVDLSTDNIFQYPVLFLTGHGNVNFSSSEADRLRRYLDAGGFLYIDDDYGLDPYIRKEMKKIYSEKDFVELPPSHKIFNVHFTLAKGVPKVHEHDDKAPQTFAIYNDKRISVIYTYESNPADGWADPDVHKDSKEKRLEALRFGANLLIFALTQ